jgi:Protein of unknown function (DUF3667)
VTADSPARLPKPDAGVTTLCQNCGAALNGPYCGACGQREHSRIVSLGHLLQEAVGDILHLDSRIWRTLRPLLLRPGLLTVEFLAGRRARYVPPFRLYLVVSIALFVLTRHLPGVGGDPFLVGGHPVFEDPAATQSVYLATQAALAAKRAELEQKGASEELREKVAALQERMDEMQSARAMAARPDEGCDSLRFSIFGSKALESRAHAACRKVAADKGASLGRAFLDNLPKMMFLLLPILALINKALYIRSRRYYVEHLLFFVHVHVFVFLVLCSIIIGNSLFALVPGGVRPPAIVSAAVWIAALAYVYLAMRRVYGQGRFKTSIKFGLLLVAYAISLGVTTLVGLLYSFLTL